MFAKLASLDFQLQCLSHAQAIMTGDFPDAAGQIEDALAEATIPIEEIIGSGGGETKGTQRLRKSLAKFDWKKTNFIVEKRINGVPKESQSHEVDHVRTFDKGLIALEIEWNNKDPFFDRDLENFKRLHSEGAISIGIIVTRGITMQSEMKSMVRRFAVEKNLKSVNDLTALGFKAPTVRQQKIIAKRTNKGIPFHDAWTDMFVADKYGAATTHWKKLEDRVKRGVGNPCPLVLIGMPASMVTFGEPQDVVAQLLAESDTTLQQSD